MIWVFIISLFATLLVTRLIAHNLHDIGGYGTDNDKSKTLTGFLRRKTGFDWHHIHFGIILLIIALPPIYLLGFSIPLTIMLGIGTSLVLDQLTPLIDRNRDYFTKLRILESIALHLIVSIIAALVI
jgi:hypothetical protein